MPRVVVERPLYEPSAAVVLPGPPDGPQIQISKCWVPGLHGEEDDWLSWWSSWSWSLLDVRGGLPKDSHRHPRLLHVVDTPSIFRVVWIPKMASDVGCSFLFLIVPVG